MEMGPTGPEKTPIDAAREKAMAEGGGVQFGIADAYWLEIAPGTSVPRRLSLRVPRRVNDRWYYDWTSLVNPDDATMKCVVEAFSFPGLHEIKVWYMGSKMFGMAIRTPGVEQ